jgi:hypothetical protein
VELGGQPHEAPRMLIFSFNKASPGAYSSYKMDNMSFLLIYACVVCALCIVFLDDGDRLHDSTLPYVIFAVEVFIFTTRCAILS